jgi:hypothetical protein
VVWGGVGFVGAARFDGVGNTWPPSKDRMVGWEGAFEEHKYWATGSLDWCEGGKEGQAWRCGAHLASFNLSPEDRWFWGRGFSRGRG